MVKYSGRFVVKDIANNIKYSADLTYKREIGDALIAGGIADAGGTTPITVDSDGKIDFLEASAGGGFCFGIHSAFNTQDFRNHVTRIIFTRQNDDTSTGAHAFSTSIGRSSSAGYDIVFRASSFTDLTLIFNNNAPAGSQVNVSLPTVKGVEYTIDIILANQYLILLRNGVFISKIPISIVGTASLSNTPLVNQMAGQKNISLYTNHAAGEKSHIKISEVYFGRLAGVSSL